MRISKTFLITVLFALSTALTGCLGAPDTAYVTEAIDGDTVRLSDGRLLRYIGIDTPEIHIRKDGRWIYDPQPYGLEAREYNAGYVEGKKIRIEYDIEKKDRYGRLLGYVFAGEKFVNAEIVRKGYGVLYTHPPNVKYVDLFVRLQRAAREEGRGLWGTYGAVSPSQAAEHIDQVRTVKGQVLSVHETARHVFLNFERNRREGFTVVIFKNALENFTSAGIDPAAFYLNRQVEVSGRIRRYHGPQIIVNHPLEIKIVEFEK